MTTFYALPHRLLQQLEICFISSRCSVLPVQNRSNERCCVHGRGLLGKIELTVLWISVEITIPRINAVDSFFYHEIVDEFLIIFQQEFEKFSISCKYFTIAFIYNMNIQLHDIRRIEHITGFVLKCNSYNMKGEKERILLILPIINIRSSFILWNVTIHSIFFFCGRMLSSQFIRIIAINPQAMYIVLSLNNSNKMFFLCSGTVF